MGGKVIFGIEEPEIYLYPQAQRALYKNFIELSKNAQIFYTTHNPNFVDGGRPDDIVLLRKNSDQGTYLLGKSTIFNAENAEKQKYKIYTHFNPGRNELFFARKALLVEGDSDKILFSALCETKWDINLDERGISIIECGGKGGVEYFLGVCRLIGFDDYYAVWDKDESLDSTSLLDETTQKFKGLELDPNLETVLGLPDGDGAKKVKNAYEWATNKDTKVPKDFEQIRTFLKGEGTESISTDEEKECIMDIEDDVPF